MKNAPRCGKAHCGAFLSLVKTGVDRVNILLVQPVLDQPQSFAEALEVDDFPCTQEFNDVVDIRIVGEPQNIVVGDAGLLLCCDRTGTTLEMTGDDACKIDTFF